MIYYSFTTFTIKLHSVIDPSTHLLLFSNHFFILYELFPHTDFRSSTDYIHHFSSPLARSPHVRNAEYTEISIKYFVIVHTYIFL
jgi:hypothetical protein